MDEIRKRHAADALDHKLGEREAIVAVDRKRARVGLEGLPGEVGEQGVVRLGVCIVKQEAVAVGAAHQAGGVVEQHAHSDVAVAFVRHGEFGDVVGDRPVRSTLPWSASRSMATVVNILLVEPMPYRFSEVSRRFFALAVYACNAAFDQRAVVHHRILHAHRTDTGVEQQLGARLGGQRGLGLLLRGLSGARERTGGDTVRRKRDRGSAQAE